MIIALKSAGIAVAFVLVGSLDYDPHVLTLRYADGRSERIAASNAKTCNMAVGAIYRGLWSVQPKPREAICSPGNAFPAGADCIANYNCVAR